MRILKIFILLFFSGNLFLHAQYTETINSNRPGRSQGAFAVGWGVLQLEAGPYLGNDQHSLYRSDTDILGADYSLRYGLITEILEINVRGSFQAENTTIRVANRDEENQRSNFRPHTVGAKVLLYDPYKNGIERKPNLYSWEANQRFNWKVLLPAISVYGGANLAFWETPYLYEGESRLSPQAAIITQNNWGRWVLVMNFIADKFTEEFPTYAGIVTLTHAFTPKLAGFTEYQGLISNIYADDIVRAGAAYLLSDNFQVDVSGLINFKDTPSRWQVAAGLSYRFDFHEEDEFLDDSFEGDRRRRRSEGNNEGNGNN